MVSFNFSFLFDTSAPEIVDFETTSRVSLLNDAMDLNGRPNKPNPPWFVQPTSDDDKSAIDRINDMGLDFAEAIGNTLGGELWQDTLLSGYDYLVGDRCGDTLLKNTEADAFIVQSQAGLDVVEDFTDGKDKLVLLGGLRFEQLGIQQQGQDTLISFGSNPLLLLKNLDATLITTTDVVSSI